MIIDVILERKEQGGLFVGSDEHKGMLKLVAYEPRLFYKKIEVYGPIAHGICEAMDTGDEFDVKSELVSYIQQNGYNSDLKDYIRNVRWL